MPPAHTYVYGALTIRAESPDRAALRWLDEFLRPAFAPAPSTTPDCTVTLTVDPAAYRSLKDAGRRPNGGDVAAFALDGGLVALPRWNSGGPNWVVFDAEYRVFFIIAPNRREVDVLADSNRPARRVAFMRVVREFAMSVSWTERRFVLHGAAVAVHGVGVAVAGPKGAGKTSLLMHLLRDWGGAQFIANDRVVVDVTEPTPQLHGMPTVVTVRTPALDLFPDVARRWRACRYDARLAMEEPQPEHMPAADTGSRNLSPAQLCALLGVDMQRQAALRLLLFPRVRPDVTGVRIRELSRPATAAAVRDACFAVRAERRTSQLFAFDPDRPSPDTATVEDIAAQVADRVPAFECDLGHGAYHAESRDALRDVIRAASTSLGLPPHHAA